MKKTIALFSEMKGREPIAVITAYDYSMARIADASGVDVVLVGDSLGMVFQGNDNTLSVTVDEMIYHTKAVKRGLVNAFCVTDMPWLSYHVSPEKAVENAGRIIQESGAEAVKLEGGREIIPAVRAIRTARIPVIGHLGLTPQSVNDFGGYKVQAKTEEDARRLLEDAKLLEEAGVSAIVLECIPADLAEIVTGHVSVATIGIGAGSRVDGQVLVIHDMAGLYSEIAPKFTRRFCECGTLLSNGISEYNSAVKEGSFPEKKHAYSIDKDVIEKLRKDFS
jgi:3-methyl-2-oxobutanoate hydroxymethyltransferase